MQDNYIKYVWRTEQAKFLELLKKQMAQYDVVPAVLFERARRVQDALNRAAKRRDNTP